MPLPRPSLAPALAGLSAFAAQLELGPHVTQLLLSLGNIAAATVLAIIGQRIKAMATESRQRRPRRKQKPRPPKV